MLLGINLQLLQDTRLVLQNGLACPMTSLSPLLYCNLPRFAGAAPAWPPADLDNDPAMGVTALLRTIALAGTVLCRRVVHAADVTGREVERALLAKAREHPNISILECHAAVDLVMGEVEGQRQCLGLDVLDIKARAMQRVVSPVTLLASGGLGESPPPPPPPPFLLFSSGKAVFNSQTALTSPYMIKGSPGMFCPKNRSQILLLVPLSRIHHQPIADM